VLSPYHQSLTELLALLHTDPVTGLSLKEITRRRAQYGANSIPHRPPPSFWQLFVRQLTDPFFIVLAVAGIIKLVVESWQDATVIFVIIAISVLISSVQERRALRVIEALRAYARTQCVVLREGKRYIICQEELVPGDIIIVHEGDKVPADVRLIQATLLRVNESMLTGESIPVDKSPEQDPNTARATLFAGTIITHGSGTAVVTQTGANTQLGILSQSTENPPVERLQNEKSTFHKEMADLSRILLIAAMASTSLVFVVGLLWGNSLNDMFFTVVSLLVSIIPAGIPVVSTIVFAIGAYQLSQKNVLVKHLASLDTLGRLDVLVIDKTGTLTYNEQTVSFIICDGTWYHVTGYGYQPTGRVFSGDSCILSAAPLSNLWILGIAGALFDQSELQYDAATQRYALKGEPMHAAIGVAIHKLGLDGAQLRATYPILHEIPFDSQTQTHAFWTPLDEHQTLACIFGAPEKIFALCAGTSAGSTTHENTLALFEQAVAQGLRTIAVAYAIIPGQSITVPTELTLAGIFGMQDAVRSDAASHIKQLQDAGILVAMATGDHQQTADYVAAQTGITTVYARVTPLAKLQIIQDYHARNQYVGMTGDGVNDAPALVAADVGIAMGRIGTDVAKEAADIVLLDDALPGITDAVRIGRFIMLTLRRLVLYLLVTSSAEVVFITMAILLGYPVPLLAGQILWGHLLTDGFLDVALGMEPAAEDPLQKKYATRRPFFSTALWLRVACTAAPMVIGSFATFAWALHTGYSLDYARSMTVMTLTMFQWFNAWNMRSDETSLFSLSPISNPWLIVTTIIVVIAQAAAFTLPFLRAALHLEPLAWIHISASFAIATAVLWVGEGIKKYRLFQE